MRTQFQRLNNLQSKWELKGHETLTRTCYRSIAALFPAPSYLDAADELQLVWDVWQELKDCNMSAKTHPFLSLLGSKDPSSSVID